MIVDAHTHLAALLGDPVAHSRSPMIHNTAFAAAGINAIYLAMRVPSEALEEAIGGIRALPFMGVNVTIPHKQAVVPLLDALTPRAQAVGAVNTIVCQRPSLDEPATLLGDNTDVAGFLAPLEPYYAALRGTEMVVLGAGGAARAVVYGLLMELRPSRLTLVARRTIQAEALADAFAGLDAEDALRVASWPDAGACVRRARLIVNTTPVGMHPAITATPWPSADDFGPQHFIYDLIYNPDPTQLMRDAEAQGARVLGGLPMLVGQAAAAWNQWTGASMPVALVEKTLAERLK